MFKTIHMKLLFGFLLLLSSTIACKKANDGNNNNNGNPQPNPPSQVVLKTADSVIVLNERPSGTKEAQRLAQSNPASDFSPTGFYLPPGGSVQIEVAQLSGTRLPVLLVGTYSRYEAKWNPTTFSLTAGTNIITDAGGGILYLRYNDESPSSQARVRFISGMKPIPYYQLGKTTQADWVKMMDNLTTVPDVQLVGERTIITFSRQNASTYKHESQEALIRKADRVIVIEDSISGLFGNDPLDQPNVHKYLLTESDDKDVFMAATHYRTWYRNTDGVQAILKAENFTWGPWHELGHMHQQGSWTWSTLGEVTVNIYSIAVEKALGITPTRLTSQGEWDKAAAYLAQPAAERDFNGSNASVWTRLCMFQQLKLAFGDAFYHELHRQARRETNRPSNVDGKMRWFMLKACTVSGSDLSGFFRKWGVKLSTQALTDALYADMTALNLPTPISDITQMRD